MSNNDWLTANASEYTVNGKTYRNLEAQVLKNMEDIANFDISDLTSDVSELKNDVEQLQTDVAGKQDELVSGTNIKTLNNGSLLGSGNIDIHGIPSGGSGGQVLAKTSNDDYAVEWADAGGGGNSGIAVFKWNTVSVPNSTPYLVDCTAEDLYTAYMAGKIVLLKDQSQNSEKRVFGVLKTASKVGTTYSAYIHGFLNGGTNTTKVLFVGTVTSDSVNFGSYSYQNVRYTGGNGTSVSSANAINLSSHKLLTYLTSAGWTLEAGGTYYTQTISVGSMFAIDLLWVSPAPVSAIDYANAKVVCYTQTDGSLEFRAFNTDSAPANDMSVNLIWITQTS